MPSLPDVIPEFMPVEGDADAKETSLKSLPGSFPLISLPITAATSTDHLEHIRERLPQLEAALALAVHAHNAVEAVQTDANASAGSRHAPAAGAVVSASSASAMQSVYARNEARREANEAVMRHAYALARNYNNSSAEDNNKPDSGRNTSATTATKPGAKPIGDVTIKSSGTTVTLTSTSGEGDIRERFMAVRDELLVMLQKTELLDAEGKLTLAGRVAMYLVRYFFLHSIDFFMMCDIFLTLLLFLFVGLC
jgi:hypothetical protein